jgi:CHAT domain-containing protein
LIIIPDKILFYLPFETLSSDINSGIEFSKMNYLIRNHDIRYHYSASIYRNSLLETQGKVTENSFLGFAPVFDHNNTGGYMLAYDNSDSLKVMEALRMVSGEDLRMNSLPYSEKEVSYIDSLFIKRKFRAESYFSDMASEENFRKKAGNFKYVHIATHGLINESEPNLSGLVFAQPEIEKDSSVVTGFYAEQTNGILYSAEINSLDLHADLLVLSACETGKGKISDGEGVMSLTRGFISAGVPNILLSLWKVGDYSTMQLMVNFYSELLKGVSYSESLQKTKLKMLKDNSTAFPKYWGAFVLMGTN